MLHVSSYKGMDGKRVGIFYQWYAYGKIPMNFNSAAFLLIWLDEVEIYKGIIPAWLGGDGLGGAVNIRTERLQQKSFGNGI